MQSLQKESESKSQVERFLDATAYYLKRDWIGPYTEPWGVRPKAILRDGHSVSIQASGSHYSRKDPTTGRWYSLELWNFSCPVPQFLGEDPDPEHPQPYAYTPIDLVDLFVAMHGGIDIEASIAAHHD